ncbi:C-3',4' desaturase CrtD [Cyanobacterium sp. Dongsha4]|uniref:C-3',4' desaturase CrtD n=1 Tax=Cyanobacterium sp. DS4 TaxID=2878255 RepID=UPI002E81E388|nr:C-3',4' desaturase CrtD [Cyanobacterium sp. Dongsha4]WVL00536.1 C-3',4' desaturase CrtD [Cyanobacterium sp. Dongsha4]
MGHKEKVIVVGAGIGGLTAGALLARYGYDVTIYDQAIVSGGCASTFKRKGFIFDVGATQVAGLEAGGIHHRVFQELGVDLPFATNCDPACAVFLPQEKQPIMVWRNQEKWKMEREGHFPDSGRFWELMRILFEASWRFQARDPILPPRSLWDLAQLLQAIRLDTFITAPFTFMTVADALRLLGLAHDKRLKTFLDMQLKLYSQVDTEETALLYAATALSVSQEPQGLYHLQGSMQVLCDRLEEGLNKHGGKLLMRHKVDKIHTERGKAVGIRVKNLKTGEIKEEKADYVIGNVTVNNLVTMTENISRGYAQRVKKLPPASGAFVVYLGVDESAIPSNCPPHLQFLYDYEGEIGEINSLFVSVSKPGDGRAPEGKATIIASSFTDVNRWWNISQAEYQALKLNYTQDAIARLAEYFNLTPETIIHQESATPVTFANYTAREKGIVGGIGQRINTFGPFGFANRTPIKNLWLVGDSTHPGEGTAGVSYSALTVVKSIMKF